MAARNSFANSAVLQTFPDDTIIVGSGAGGAAAAYYLARTGERVLLLERGPELAKSGETLSVARVMRDKAFVAHETWTDRAGASIRPEERANLGGKTKWYGAALVRFAPEEFAPDPEHQCLGWPIAYETFEPYYRAAESLLEVRRFPTEPDLTRILATLGARGWQTRSLPVGLHEAILEHPEEMRHFDGFSSPRDLKRDAETAFLAAVRTLPNLTIATGVEVAALLPDPTDPRRVAGVRTADGTIHRARRVLLAAGALHSPRLLARYLEATGLAHQLPCTRNVGRNYKFHVLTAVLGFALREQNDALRKTDLILSTRFPHSSVQPLGWFDGELFGAAAPYPMPRWVAHLAGRRAYGFFLQTEDGSHPDNRVVAGAPPRLDYDLARLPAAREEHARLVATFKRDLIACGYLPVARAIGIEGSAHACGTLAAGADPQRSVVDARGRVHGMSNLYVTDGSALPRSSRANPALTIFAWALMVASGIAQELANDVQTDFALRELS